MIRCLEVVLRRLGDGTGQALPMLGEAVPADLNAGRSLLTVRAEGKRKSVSRVRLFPLQARETNGFTLEAVLRISGVSDQISDFTSRDWTSPRASQATPVPGTGALQVLSPDIRHSGH